MRAVVQRVKNCAVHVQEELVGAISDGLLVYIGVFVEDTERDVLYIAEKIANLRIFADEQGKMNLSAKDLKKEILVVSQFTLYGDARKGRRPSYTHAAAPDKARELCNLLVAELRNAGFHVEEGRFGSIMDVGYINHGPITILLDSQKSF